MIDAAQRGDTAAIAAAMRTGNDEFDVNARDIQHGMTALLWACSCDEADVVKLLLMDPRVDRRALSKYEMAVLHHAAAANAMRVLPLLLDDDASFPVDGCNEWKETALHLAAAAGHRAAVGALLRAGASVTATDKWGRTPSFVARQQGLQPGDLGLPSENELETQTATEATTLAHAHAHVDLFRELAELQTKRKEKNNASAVGDVEVKHMFSPMRTAAKADVLKLSSTLLAEGITEAPPPPLVQRPQPPPSPPPPPPTGTRPAPSSRSTKAAAHTAPF